jgi:hypothetical protein
MCYKKVFLGEEQKCFIEIAIIQKRIDNITANYFCLFSFLPSICHLEMSYI